MSARKPPKRFNPEPFDYHEEVEFVVSTLTNLGLGLGRVNDWVVMVPFALPGERVRVRIYRNHKNYSEADLVEVIEPSPDRVEPQCGLFGLCGGCQYQNFAYEKQLEWKQRQVGELLRHMAGIEGLPVNPVIPSPLQYGYRSKITPHFQKPKKGTTDLGPIGFLQAGRRFEIVDVPTCPIAAPAINEKLAEVREEVRDRATSYKKGATLLFRLTKGDAVLTESQEICEEEVGELTFQFPAGDFFQNNPSILPAFVGYVREQAHRSGARYLVDAYCGSGLFALSCASEFEQVYGVEVSEGSITWARRNAERNGISNARFLLGSAEAIFEELQETPGAETAVVIDPPRRGSSEEFLRQLFEFAPVTVVYVSCNPATQMRDLKLFLEAGYRPVEAQPFDLFPQTRHLECVLTLQKVVEET